MLIGITSNAQHVRVRLNFPVGISVGAPARRLSAAPYGLDPNGNGGAAGMNMCPAIGQGQTGMGLYGFPVTGNIQGEVTDGCQATGDKIYRLYFFSTES